MLVVVMITFAIIFLVKIFILSTPSNLWTVCEQSVQFYKVIIF